MNDFSIGMLEAKANNGFEDSGYVRREPQVYVNGLYGRFADGDPRAAQTRNEAWHDLSHAEVKDVSSNVR